MCGNLVEIPASLPDDLQLHDGLRLGEEGITRAWTEILHQTHQRGELFTLLFHPESFEHCRVAIERVLGEAQRLRPTVWRTQLREVSRWWREKASFAVNVSAATSGIAIRFDCSDRATVLVRNLPTSAPTHPWAGSYQVLESRTLQVVGDRRPFVGVAPAIAARTRAFLTEQGYIVDASDSAPACAVYLDTATVARLETERRLIEHIESAPGPLARYWRWPDEARSALCITGDLDALSLLDYAARLFTR